MSLSQELTWRGFVNQTTLDSAADLDKEKLTFYWGVDPSAPSMTVGNLALAMMVRHFIDHGHKAVLLVGGATGMIGDPDGKAAERELLSKEEIGKNKQAIVDQFKTIFKGQDFRIVDNYDWFKNIGYLDFLRDVGKHVPMRQMLGREFLQTRLGEGGPGISYAEFSYSLIQGYDFLHLFKEHGVTLQVCGSDQWGNSIAGVDLIRRKLAKAAHVWSAPLVLNAATGQKFGKTEQGAVWLDAKLTSPYDFYQFWFNTDDQGVEDYLKIYTLLRKDEISKIMKEFRENPSERLAQKTLASEVTKLVHGEEPLGENDSAEIPYYKTKGEEQDIFELLTKAFPQKVTSLSEARRLVGQGGVKLNGNVVKDSVVTLNDGDVLKVGKRHSIKVKRI